MHSFANARPTFDGIVTKKMIGNYVVQQQERKLVCSISTRLRRELVYPIADPNSLRHVVVDVRKLDVVDPVAVGDQVRFIDAQDGTGMIVEVLPRRSRLARSSATPMSGYHAKEQVIVANLDLVVAVMSAAKPAPKWNLLDRYLVSAESLELPILVCITKFDLAGGDVELLAAVEEYQRIGYPVVMTSAQTSQGLDLLRLHLRGRLSVFVGKSGVGKTTLLNAIQPGLGLQVQQVNRKTGKGRHTTTNLEMFALDFGGSVIDTPGMREFGLWDIEPGELAPLFPEMRPWVGHCRFGLDCRHIQEPGCAILSAVEAGEISQMRYSSFLRLLED
jgi:ribosome biogenesis GTPase